MSIVSHHMLMSSIRGGSPTPPTPPTYEYSILQNFVEGHSISEPDTTQGDSWITQVLSEDDLSTDWLDTSYQYLVNDTIGSKLIDSRKPLDFSKYNITSGTPYGMSSNNWDSDWCDLAFNIEHNVYPITVETFAFARSSSYYKDRNYYNPDGYVPIFMLGKPSVNNGTGYNLTLEVGGNEVRLYIQGGWNPYDSQILFELDCSTDEDLHIDTHNEGYDLSYWLVSWHHYALCIDNSNIYILLDGKLKGSVPLSTECSFDVMVQGTWQVEHRSGTLKQMLDAMNPMVYVKQSNDNQSTFDGAYAQFAVCNQCKWTSDFTPPTEAY